MQSKKLSEKSEVTDIFEDLKRDNFEPLFDGKKYVGLTQKL